MLLDVHSLTRGSQNAQSVGKTLPTLALGGLMASTSASKGPWMAGSASNDFHGLAAGREFGFCSTGT
jgi:hypothetical protein